MPRTYSEYKIPLVLLLVCIIFMEILWTRRLRLHPDVFIWLLVFLAHGLVWVLIGSLKYNPGISDYFRLSVLWVILYGLFISGVSGKHAMNVIVKMIVFAGGLISFYNIALILKTIGVIPDNYLFNLEMGANIGIHTGYIQLTAHNIGTLAFVAPFLFSLMVFSDAKTIMNIKRRTVFLVLLITVSTVIFSGRRILWINILITPMVCYMHSVFIKNRSSTWNKKLLFTTISLLFVGMVLFGYFSIYTDWSVGNFIEHFSSAFEEEDRLLQSSALYEGFAENPILGTGFGRGVPTVIRSYEKPWVYEMSYNIMLHNIGIVGMAIYLGCIGWIYRVGLKLANKHPVERPILLALLVGMTNFLIANATNPYFASYDFMWTLFLPIAYINHMMLNPDRLSNNNPAPKVT
jgi:hypothetical protein